MRRMQSQERVWRGLALIRGDGQLGRSLQHNTEEWFKDKEGELALQLTAFVTAAKNPVRFLAPTWWLTSAPGYLTPSSDLLNHQAHHVHFRHASKNTQT